MRIFLDRLPTIIGIIFTATILTSQLAAHPHEEEDSPSHNHQNGWIHENGIGPDPDRDSNPATNTRIIPFIGDAKKASQDPVHTVITFEPPPGEHGQIIDDHYKEQYGLSFGKGLSRQICTSKRLLHYDTMCTYEAPTSGEYAAGYLSHNNHPLFIEFDKPVCVVTMSIYPTGGKEGEPFEFTIEGWSETGQRFSQEKVGFKWTNNTVRWRNMAGAYFIGQPAKRISISMRSKDAVESKKTLRYLIDDFAFVNDQCDAALDDIQQRTGIDLREDATGQ